jgi:hypothetical protein
MYNTFYYLDNTPFVDRAECYRGLARVFEHAFGMGFQIDTLGLVYASGDTSSNVLIIDPFTGQTTSNGANALDSTVINVISTAGFSTDGYIYIKGGFCWHTGKTATSFLQCGGHLALSDGDVIYGVPYALVVGVHAADSATINVNETDGFPSSGSFKLTDFVDGKDDHQVTYTGKTATSFTGCGPHHALVGDEEAWGAPALTIEQANHLGMHNDRLTV